MQCIRREIPFIFGIRWLTLVYTFLGFIPQHCSTQLYHWQSLPAEFNPKHKRQKAKPGVCDMKWCNAVTQWFLSLLKLWEYHLLQYHCSMTYWKNISTRAVCESVCVLLPWVVETWGADRLLFNRLQGEHGDPLIVCTHAHTHTASFLSQNSVEYSYTEAVGTLPGARVCAGRGACTQQLLLTFPQPVVVVSLHWSIRGRTVFELNTDVEFQQRWHKHASVCRSALDGIGVCYHYLCVCETNEL